MPTLNMGEESGEQAYFCPICETACIDQRPAPRLREAIPYKKYPSSSAQNLSPVFNYPSTNVSFVGCSLSQYPRAMLPPLSHKFSTWFRMAGVPSGVSERMPVVPHLFLPSRSSTSLTGWYNAVIVCMRGRSRERYVR